MMGDKGMAQGLKDAMQEMWKNRGRIITKWILEGYRLDELVMINYIGWPKITRLDIVTNDVVFEIADRFKIEPKNTFDGSTTQRKSGLHQGLRMECNPYKAKEDPDETTSTFTV